MSSSPIALVENAIVACLRDVPRPYTGLTVESYAGQLDDELFAWIRVLPAVWVTFGGISDAKRMGQRSVKSHATFEVLSAQRALVENDGRLNDASQGADVGVYTLLEDNKLALVNQKLGLAIQPFTPGAIRPVMKSMVNHQAVVVYSQEFHTDWMEFFAEPPVTPDGELQTIGFSYYLKPQHTPPGDPADKTDEITLT